MLTPCNCHEIRNRTIPRFAFGFIVLSLLPLGIMAESLYFVVTISLKSWHFSGFDFELCGLHLLSSEVLYIHKMKGRAMYWDRFGASFYHLKVNK
jgi:hypothetical protein